MLSEIEIKHACRLDRAMKVTYRYAETDGCIYDLIISCLHLLSVEDEDLPNDHPFKHGKLLGIAIGNALSSYRLESQEYLQTSQPENRLLLERISQDIATLCRELDCEFHCDLAGAVDACESYLGFNPSGSELDHRHPWPAYESIDMQISKVICDVLHLIEYRIEQNQFPSLLSLGIPNTTAEIMHLCIGVFLEEAFNGNHIDQVAMERLHDNLVAFFEEIKSGISKDVLSQV
jgi:hypothetical protein